MTRKALYLKHLLVRTPLERPLLNLRELFDWRHRRQHPELAAIHAEPSLIRQIVRRALSPQSNAIDVGCHLGTFLSLIYHCSPHGSHVAFEPTPWKVAWLRKKFPEAMILDVAVGDANETVRFFENVTRPGCSGLQRHEGANKQVREYEVSCRRLDDLIDPDHHVDLVKIDVEGSELRVLKGARRILTTQHPIVLFESTHTALAASGIQPEQIYDHLTADLQYHIYLPRDFVDTGPPLQRDAFITAHTYPFKAFNFVAQR